MTNYEVLGPILNSPFEEPKKYWLIEPITPVVESWFSVIDDR
jgi:hypothetical protein